jgi:hypothetical protein
MEEEIPEPKNHENEPMDTGKDPDPPEPPQLIAALTPLTQKTSKPRPPNMPHLEEDISLRQPARRNARGRRYHHLSNRK